MPRRPDPLLLDVGRRVAELRRARGWTQEKFAERAEVSVGYVREVEGGHENLSLLSLAKIAALLGVTVPDLLVAPASRTVRRGRPPRVPPSAGAAPPHGQSREASVRGEELEAAVRKAASLAAEQGSREEERTIRTQVKNILTALEIAIRECQVAGGKTRSTRREKSSEFLSSMSKIAVDLLAAEPASFKPRTRSQGRRTSKRQASVRGVKK